MAWSWGMRTHTRRGMKPWPQTSSTLPLHAHRTLYTHTLFRAVSLALRCVHIFAPCVKSRILLHIFTPFSLKCPWAPQDLHVQGGFFFFSFSRQKKRKRKKKTINSVVVCTRWHLSTCSIDELPFYAVIFRIKIYYTNFKLSIHACAHTKNCTACVQQGP